jgi:hypothetical protein
MKVQTKIVDSALSRAASHNGAGPKGKSMRAVSNPPVQREGGWFETLVEMAKANPLGAALTVGAGAAAILAYYYFRQHPAPRGQAPREAEEPPDWTTLAGVARQVNVSPEVLRTQLETGVGDLTINDIYRKGFDPGTQTLTGLVPPSILVNLPATTAEKVETIFNRINQFRFTYTGFYQAGGNSFLSGTGDCRSLAERFLLALQAAGVQGAEFESDETAMIVASHAIHGRDTVANLDGTPLWFFHDHHWVTYQGTRYDLLFMDHQTPQSWHRTDENLTHNEVHYDVFEGNTAVIHASQFDKLTAPLTAGRVGRAMPVAQVKTFIDTNKKV